MQCVYDNLGWFGVKRNEAMAKNMQIFRSWQTLSLFGFLTSDILEPGKDYTYFRNFGSNTVFIVDILEEVEGDKSTQ